MTWHVIEGDCIEAMAAMDPESVQCVVTSPPYWGLRDYGVDGQLGLESTPDEYVESLVGVFRGVRRVLRLDGVVWLNLGDSYASGGGSGRQGETGERADRTHTQQFLGVNRGARQVGDTKNPAAGIPSVGPNRFPLVGLKPKDLVGIPWMVAFALRADGWYLRADIVWSKPNPMPESVTDRPTKSHEYVFLLTKSARYFYDSDAVAEPFQSSPSDLRKMVEGQDRIGGLVKDSVDPLARASSLTNMGRKRSVGNGVAAAAALGRKQDAGQQVRIGGDTYTGFNDRWDEAEAAGELPGGRNMRSVWSIATEPFPGAHFATFPKKLVEPCVKAGSALGDTVLDPFAGSGTVGLVAARLGRSFVGVELNPVFAEMARNRIRDDAPLFNPQAEVVS